MADEAINIILNELGEALEVKDLKLDKNNTCLIRFQNGLELYLEPYKEEEEILIVSELIELPPGPFREKVLREALIANGFPYPRHGTFAYSDQSSKLILFKKMPIKNLTGDKIASYLGQFMTRALAWKEPLERGEVPVAATLATSSGRGSRPSSGMFGGLVP